MREPTSVDVVITEDGDEALTTIKTFSVPAVGDFIGTERLATGEPQTFQRYEVIGREWDVRVVEGHGRLASVWVRVKKLQR